MRLHARFVFALLLAFIARPATAADPPELDPKAIDAAVETALKEFEAPGAAVVVVGW